MTHHPIQLYMILGAVGYERGPPISLFFDPFKARAAFATYSDMAAAFGAGYTAFLVAYESYPDGTLVELEEIGRK
jgi:hypothetical protein